MLWLQYFDEYILYKFEISLWYTACGMTGGMNRASTLIYWLDS